PIWTEVDDAGLASFLHGLVLGEDPEPGIQIDDFPVDASDLSWPAAGERHALNEFAERRALDRGQNQFAFRRGEDAVADEPLGFLDVGDGIDNDVLLLNRPIESALQGAN